MSVYDSLLGADPQDAMITDVMMVGAEYGFFQGLSPNDQVLLSIFLSGLREFKIPYDPKFIQCEEALIGDGIAPVDVVNILSEYGGRNFFQENGRPDAIMLCNIPKDPPVNIDDTVNDPHLTAIEQYRLRKSFAASDGHSPERWRDHISILKPKIVFLSGHDSFEPEELRGDDFISIANVGRFMSVLISKDYLEGIEAYLALCDSPLYDCVISNQNSFTVAEEYPRKGDRNDYAALPSQVIRPC